MLAAARADMLADMTPHTTYAPTLEPLAVPADGGEARWWFGGLTVVKATAADTGGQMTILEATEPPDTKMPLHVHHREDEGFWMLEGSATFEIGDRTIEAKAGDYLFGPRQIPHRYTTGPEGCRILFILTPGGIEELVMATSTPAAQRTLPPPAARPPSDEEAAAIAAAIAAHECAVLEH